MSTSLNGGRSYRRKHERRAGPEQQRAGDLSGRHRGRRSRSRRSARRRRDQRPSLPAQPCGNIGTAATDHVEIDQLDIAGGDRPPLRSATNWRRSRDSRTSHRRRTPSRRPAPARRRRRRSACRRGADLEVGRGYNTASNARLPAACHAAVIAAGSAIVAAQRRVAAADDVKRHPAAATAATAVVHAALAPIAAAWSSPQLVGEARSPRRGQPSSEAPTCPARRQSTTSCGGPPASRSGRRRARPTPAMALAHTRISALTSAPDWRRANRRRAGGAWLSPHGSSFRRRPAGRSPPRPSCHRRRTGGLAGRASQARSPAASAERIVVPSAPMRCWMKRPYSCTSTHRDHMSRRDHHAAVRPARRSAVGEVRTRWETEVDYMATIGVDIGTSSTKGVLVTLTGTIVATAVRAHDIQRPAPGHVEADGASWWQEFVSIAHELAARAAADGITIGAIGVSGMGPCTLITDGGTPWHRRSSTASTATAEIAELTSAGAAAVVETAGRRSPAGRRPEARGLPVTARTPSPRPSCSCPARTWSGGSPASTSSIILGEPGRSVRLGGRCLARGGATSPPTSPNTPRLVHRVAGTLTDAYDHDRAARRLPSPPAVDAWAGPSASGRSASAI